MGTVRATTSSELRHQTPVRNVNEEHELSEPEYIRDYRDGLPTKRPSCNRAGHGSDRRLETPKEEDDIPLAAGPVFLVLLQGEYKAMFSKDEAAQFSNGR